MPAKPKVYPDGEAPIQVDMPPEPDDPVPPEKQGVIYKGGYFARSILPDELPAFRELYRIFKQQYPDLDLAADDALLCEGIKTLIMLQRAKPPAPPSEEAGKSSNRFDYEIARKKILVALWDSLGINRKQRKEQETGADIEKALARFFTQDGRTRKDAGRTVAKNAAPVVVDELAASRAARENDERFRES